MAVDSSKGDYDSAKIIMYSVGGIITIGLVVILIVKIVITFCKAKKKEEKVTVKIRNNLTPREEYEYASLKATSLRTEKNHEIEDNDRTTSLISKDTQVTVSSHVTAADTISRLSNHPYSIIPA
mmetsp:Transcript_650/g.648  ORF Transcript_650/g.648 Transcript_650/m.648 type:complete len:124 (+) Transcript_650:53-424(+)